MGYKINKGIKTIQVSGQSNVVADNDDAAITLAAGSNVTITTNASTDTVTIAASSDVVDDTTPQLGGDLDVNGKVIVSASNGDIEITPNGSGDIILDSQKWPQADGSSGQYLKTDGSGQLSWGTVSGGGGSGIASVAADTTPQLGGDLDVNGKDIVSASNGDITLTPNGSGDVILDGQKWPQADGSSGQYLKTDGSGQLSWGTVSGGGGGGSVDLLGSSTSAITPGASAAIDATHAANHTISTDNVIIPVDTSSSGANAAVTITLYAASGNAGRIVCVKDVGGAAYTNNITIDANSSETIDGQTTQAISSNYGAVKMFCDGSNWFII